MNRFTSISSTVDGVSNFNYDKESQITAAAHLGPSRPDESFSYDQTGNRNGTGYTVGEDNLTTAANGFSYDYDAEGNRIRKENDSTNEYETYEWDHRNRLVKVEQFNASDQITNRIEYAYDAFNRMVRRTEGIATVTDITDEYFAGFDGNLPTLEFERTFGSTETVVDLVAADLQRRNLIVGDHIVAQEDASNLNAQGEVTWALTDQVGTVRDLVRLNSSNLFEVANHRVYDSFGNLTSETDSSVDFDYSFTGRWTDGTTGLTHHLHRWFDPTTGKWLSDDPIGFAAGDVNLQRYVGNRSIQSYNLNGLLATPIQTQESGSNQGQSSQRDKDLVDPQVGVGYEKTPENIEKIMEGIRNYYPRETENGTISSKPVSDSDARTPDRYYANPKREPHPSTRPDAKTREFYDRLRELGVETCPLCGEDINEGHYK